MVYVVSLQVLRSWQIFLPCLVRFTRVLFCYKYCQWILVLLSCCSICFIWKFWEIQNPYCSHYHISRIPRTFYSPVQFSSVQSLSHVQLFTTPGTAVHQASLSITNSQSLLILMSISLVMPSNHLILCHPLLLPPSVFPSIRVFFQLVGSLAKVLEFQLQYQSFQWIFRTGFL